MTLQWTSGQVDSSILVAWVGNLAAKLSLACSNCAVGLNVDAVCSAGVSGLVSAFGEIAAGGCLAAAACTGTPPQLTTSKVSALGDQTVRGGRRLVIGQGPVGNGVQCGVDVGMVAANIAAMGLAINQAVNINKCGNYEVEATPENKLKGITDALCTIDIAGAVAYVSQVVTFINLIVVHCQDFLEVNALCAGSIAAITTGAAAIAAYSGALHDGCRYNKYLKSSKARADVAALWPVPTIDDLLHPAAPVVSRRLDEAAKEPSLQENLKIIEENKQHLRKHMSALGMNMSAPQSYSQADKETFLRLMEGGLDEPRAAWPFKEC